VVDEVLALLEQPGADTTWMEHAACGDADQAPFFPSRGESSDKARAICRRCPVRVPCLEYALAANERHGVWAGTSERQRRRAQVLGLSVDELLAEVDQPRRVVRSTIGGR
jgi:WhiB family redox-sensing transcriptional regulator